MFRLRSLDCLTLRLHSMNILLMFAEELIYTFIYVFLTFPLRSMFQFSLLTSFIYISVIPSLYFVYISIQTHFIDRFMFYFHQGMIRFMLSIIVFKQCATVITLHSLKLLLIVS